VAATELMAGNKPQMPLGFRDLAAIMLTPKCRHSRETTDSATKSKAI
jgi:hypothetical protein